MKIRMSSIDLRAIVCHLRKNLVGSRLSNVYSIDKKKYLMKFSRSGAESKNFLLIDSGTRIHTTKYEREKSAIPNPFVIKIRKTIKGRVLRDVKQLGVDRIIVLSFGPPDLDPNNSNHLIVEFFSKGNVLLTDGAYKIMTLLRAHRHDVRDRGGKGNNNNRNASNSPNSEKKKKKKNWRKKQTNNDEVNDEEEGNQFRVSKIYPYIQHYTKHERIKKESIEKIFQDFDEKLCKSESYIKTKNGSNLYHQTIKIIREKKADKPNLLKFQILKLSKCYSREMVEHALIRAGLHGDTKFSHIHKEDLDDVIENLNKGFQECDEIFERMENEPGPGFIIFTQVQSISNNSSRLKKKKAEEEEEEVEGEEEGEQEEDEKEPIDIRYQSYSPVFLEVHRMNGLKVKEYESFSDVVDEYYSKFDAMRISGKKETARKKVERRVDRLKKEYENKISHSRRQIEEYEKKAKWVETNIDIVNKSLELVNSALASSMNWEEIQRVFREQKKSGHPIIRHVQRLDFSKNQMILQDLNDEKKKSNKRRKQTPFFSVLIDLSKSGYGNMEHFYEKKRDLEYKLSKSIEMSEQALQKTEKKAQLRLRRLQEAAGVDIHKFKKRFWFQKFYWFISSDRYLVLGGRDAQTNELLVKRYMRPNDAYVHPNLRGGSSVLVKNRFIEFGSESVPAQTLHEAGVFSVSHSKAWKDKIPIEAYWVDPDQVSKTAESGEYLTTGSFMVRGKKKFFPHFGSFSRGLAMGVGLLFQLDEESWKKRGEESVPVTPIATPVSESSEYENRNPFFEREEKEKDEKKEEEENEEVVEEKKEEEEEIKLFDWSVLSYPEKRRRFNKRDKRRFRNLMKKKGMTSESATDMVVQEKIEQEKKTIELKKRKKKDDEKSEEEKKVTMTSDEYFYEQQMKETAKEVEKVDENNEDENAIKQIIEKREHQVGKKKKNKKRRRGKRNRKYVDQDEEERKIRMLLMGVKEGEKPKNSSHKKKKSKEEEEKESAQKNKNGKKPNKELELIIKRQEKRKLLEATQNKDLLTEEKKQWEDESEEKERMSEIDYLTGNPKEDDVLLCCIPVFAPFDTIKDYKYRVKIMPGQMKRGEAVKEILNLFQSEVGENVKERVLMKMINHNEMAQTIEGNVQIVRERKKVVGHQNRGNKASRSKSKRHKRRRRTAKK